MSSKKILKDLNDVTQKFQLIARKRGIRFDVDVRSVRTNQGQDEVSTKT